MQIMNEVSKRLLEENIHGDYFSNVEELNKIIEEVKLSLSIIEDIDTFDNYEFSALVMFFYRNSFLSPILFIGRKKKNVIFDLIKDYTSFEKNDVDYRKEEYLLATEKKKFRQKKKIS